MAQEIDKADVDSTVHNIATAKEPSVENKKNQREQQVLEINTQMTALESSIDKLNKKLNTTNRQIKSDVKRLTESDADITEKVADTYKQLGVIETSLENLNAESSKINADLKKVNKQIKTFEKQSAAALNTAIEQQAEINGEFRDSHDAIIKRAEKLSKKVSTISTKLNKSIRDNSKALTALEAKIVSELENIAQASEQRDSDLDGKITSANDEISTQKAKMLMMQKVDEALEKRAAALEDTTSKLIDDSEELRKSTDALDVLTTKLAGEVEALEIHTAQLAAQNAEQQGFIDTLQQKSEELATSLLALARLEKKHVSILGGISLLLLLAIIGLFVFDQYQRNQDGLAQSDRATAVDQQVNQLQGQVQNEQLASQVFEAEIAGLQQNIDSIKQEMQGMNDQVESLDGRVQYLAPLYNFGSDNTIHGSHWLQQLKPEQFSIRIADVSDKQELYEIAQRYNNYFTQELAYFVNSDDQYTLIYGGQFETEQEVVDAVAEMPRFMNFQRIGVVANSEVLAQLKQ